MKPTLKSQWQALRRGSPGHRFQERYHGSRRGANRATLIQRIVRVAIATAAIAIGVVLVFIPGPAVLFFAIAGALLATESIMVARFLDCSEVKLRRMVRWALRLWKKMSVGGKTAAVAVAGTASLAAGYVAYRMMRG